MLKIRQIILGFSFFTLTHCFATQEATDSFAKVDAYFVQHYNIGNRWLGQHTRPILVVNGFLYQLYTKNGSVQNFNSLVTPFNELKAISHIGPGIYAIASAHWRDPANSQWQTELKEYQAKIQQALKQVKNIDWNNPAWPGKGGDLEKFMADSLQMADHFITQILQKKTFTVADYQLFSQHYMHTMLATMYLADLANTKYVLNQLKIWKQQLGDAEWKKLYVLIMGSKGRTTSELTLKTNTAALTVASTMNPKQAQSNIIIMPMVADFNHAQGSLGAIINSKQLAFATFTTPKAQNATGIYNALLTATIPLARDNVVHIVDKSTLKQRINLPYIGILPKDRGFLP